MQSKISIPSFVNPISISQNFGSSCTPSLTSDTNFVQFAQTSPKDIKLPALGIDHGQKWIGLSACDFNGDFVWSLGDIEIAKYKEKIEEVILERNISTIVLGYPLMLDGSEGEQCRITREFKTCLDIFGLPIFFQDERLSNRGKFTHSAAAVEILERWLMAYHRIRSKS